MNTVVVLILIGFILFIIQTIFFLSCMKWLRSGKINRDKEFALLDSERSKLFEFQAKLSLEIAEAKKLAHETLNKLRIIGAEAHAEWEDVTKKINNIMYEVEIHTQNILEENFSKLSIKSLALEKCIKEARQISVNLENYIEKSKKIIRLFDQTVPQEDIFKELQLEKYAQAKKMLEDGIEASIITKKLGLSLNEVMTISSCQL